MAKLTKRTNQLALKSRNKLISKTGHQVHTNLLSKPTNFIVIAPHFTAH